MRMTLTKDATLILLKCVNHTIESLSQEEWSGAAEFNQAVYLRSRLEAVAEAREWIPTVSIIPIKSNEHAKP